jgi:hypothetical protein
MCGALSDLLLNLYFAWNCKTIRDESFLILIIWNTLKYIVWNVRKKCTYKHFRIHVTVSIIK